MRRLWICSLLIVLAASIAQADQVTLKNGDRLTGKIATGDGKTLLLKTEFTGDVTIQWDAITSIESVDVVHLMLKDGTQLAGKVTTQDGKFVVAAASTAASIVRAASKDTIVAVRNDAEQKAFDQEAERMAHPKFTYFWSGLFDTGLALTRGNSATSTFTLASKAVRETPRDKLTLYGNYIYGKDSSTPPDRTTANSLAAGVRGDLNITPRVFVFALADYQTNELQHLDLRQVYGGGFGYHLIKTERVMLDAFGGFTYQRDAFGQYALAGPPIVAVPAVHSNTAAAVIGEELSAKLSKRSTFTERFSVYPNLSRTGDIRSQFDTTLVTQIKAWLSWQTTLSDSYINYPPPGLKANDLLLSTGLRVKWGKAKL